MMKSNRGNTPMPVEGVRIYSYDRAIERLGRAIAMSHGQFSLILLCCNDALLQEKVVKQITHQFSGIKHLAIDSSLNKLYSTIKKTVLNQQPEALMVFGLESVEEIDKLLTSSNLIRNQFRKCFSFPLVLWVNDGIIKKLVRLAPDFKNWATTIRFTVPENPRETLTQPSHKCFNDIPEYQFAHSVKG
jgi:hypothetical protein